MTRYLYSELANAVQARLNCKRAIEKAQCFHAERHDGRCETCEHWFDMHAVRAESLTKDHMPHGSGFDSGTTIDLDASHADKLVFQTSFHHMNKNGFYDGWTYHTVIVTPSLTHGFHVRIGGPNRNDIKEHIGQEFYSALKMEVQP